jgi:hypothetical protein
MFDQSVRSEHLVQAASGSLLRQVPPCAGYLKLALAVFSPKAMSSAPAVAKRRAQFFANNIAIS